jgi:diacylglycerol kinase family enzyme
MPPSRPASRTAELEPAPDARRLQRVEVVASVASGSVGPEAPDEIRKIFSDFGIPAHVYATTPDELEDRLRRAVDAAPDLLVILAGDGTARTAAQLCGPDGPAIAPLAGGTMNILPHAIYGARPWQDALTIILAQGAERMLGGGDIEGRRFLVSAILGPPALWGAAREAVRYGRVGQALSEARAALRRAFTGRLRYALDDGPREKARAMLLMCPTASRALNDDEQVLEAAGLDVDRLAQVVRLGWNALIRDWRDDPAVESARCRVARIWSAQGIPAILDGESVQLRPLAEARFEPRVVKVLCPPKDV